MYLIKNEEIQKKVSNYSAEDFVTQFEKICANFAHEFSILSFAIVIYDESNPEFRKIFRDKDYWDALVKASGERLIIFTLKDSPKEKHKTSKSFIASFNGGSYPKTISYSNLLNKVFGSKRVIIYPSVLLFQIYNGSIYNYHLIPLPEKNEYNSFADLQKLIKLISDVLDKIDPENYGNLNEIFNLIESELLRQKFNMWILKGPKIVSDLLKILRIV